MINRNTDNSADTYIYIYIHTTQNIQVCQIRAFYTICRCPEGC